MPLYLPPARQNYLRVPTDHGNVQAWTQLPEQTSNSIVNVSGTLYLVRIQVPQTITVTNIIVYVQTAGATLTAGQNLLGLYTSAGAKIAQTADQTSWTTTGQKTAALTGGPFTIQGGPTSFIYGAVLSVGTTPPVFRGMNVNANQLNVGQTAAVGTATCLSLPTQTTLPASVAPTTLSGIGQWFALS